jgi:hypothetical protein
VISHGSRTYLTASRGPYRISAPSRTAGYMGDSYKNPAR